ncbi:MAG: Unknown protein [uncultured Sulfurovum sp.]|uniref:Uncharacterized protein n=1 Tax=uncultured Sulfurovum sp. TaxID=269237 RepID=A0A6S6T9Y0_9BACT|nr:MAG: Unknown protein [uncultured Sulfurovum sp.]
MAKEETKRYLELQMEELKAAHATENEDTPKKPRDNKGKNAHIAKLYEDAAEYEEDLKGFEEELEIVNSNSLKDIAQALINAFPEEERDYAQELDTILDIGWTHFIEVEKTHSKEELELIKQVEFGQVVEALNEQYPEYSGDFEQDVRGLLVKRWENLIEIKKEHIKQEHAEIKTAGLKPKFVKRAYEQFHGIVK